MQLVEVRIYRAAGKRNIQRKFQRDAARMASLGYVVTSQEYIRGGCLKGCLFFFLSPLSQDSLQVTYQRVRA